MLMGKGISGSFPGIHIVQNQIKRKTQTEMPDPDFQVVMRSSITFGFAQKEILYRR